MTPATQKTTQPNQNHPTKTKFKKLIFLQFIQMGRKLTLKSVKHFQPYPKIQRPTTHLKKNNFKKVNPPTQNDQTLIPQYKKNRVDQ